MTMSLYVFMSLQVFPLVSSFYSKTYNFKLKTTLFIYPFDLRMCSCHINWPIFKTFEQFKIFLNKYTAHILGNLCFLESLFSCTSVQFHSQPYLSKDLLSHEALPFSEPRDGSKQD